MASTALQSLITSEAGAQRARDVPSPYFPSLVATELATRAVATAVAPGASAADRATARELLGSANGWAAVQPTRDAFSGPVPHDIWAELASCVANDHVEMARSGGPVQAVAGRTARAAVNAPAARGPLAARLAKFDRELALRADQTKP